MNYVNEKPEIKSIIKPKIKPSNPRFSSGPCPKPPNWSVNSLSNASVGRSHRSKECREKLSTVINLSKEILNIPDDYKLAIVPASDTGAMEMALWSLLGERKVDIFAWEAFSLTWLRDIVNQLKIDNQQYTADYGDIADLSQYNPHNDCVFVFNGTSSGIRVPNLDWIAEDREGLAICDATSAIFSEFIDFKKLDVVTWSWQKALGGEGAHGMILLSPRAVHRLETYTPSWPIPKIFTLVKNGKIIDELFDDSPINTPSMLCVEDVINSLQWVKSIGGQDACQKITNENFSIIENWVSQNNWIEFLAKDAYIRSNTSVCLTIVDKRFTDLSEKGRRAKINLMCDLLEKNNAAYDIASYKMAPAGLRIYCGPTVNSEDIKKLLPWIEWAFYDILTIV